jgi:hypothetical protein
LQTRFYGKAFAVLIAAPYEDLVRQFDTFLKLSLYFEWILSGAPDSKRAAQLIVSDLRRPLFFVGSAVGELIPSGLVG